MAGTTGLEPATSAVTGQRSNQLSYVPKLLDTRINVTLHRAIFSFRSILTVAAPTPSSGWMTADLYATTRFSLSEDDGPVSTVAVVNRVLPSADLPRHGRYGCQTDLSSQIFPDVFAAAACVLFVRGKTSIVLFSDKGKMRSVMAMVPSCAYASTEERSTMSFTS